MNENKTQIARELLERLAKENQALTGDSNVTRQRMVDAATAAVESDKNSPLGLLFTWDDTIAGAKYRLAEAGRWMRIVTFKIVRPDSGTLKEISPKIVRLHGHRMFGSTGIDRKSGVGSRLMSEIMTTPVQKESMLQTALAALNGLRKVHADLKELQGVWAEVAKVEVFLAKESEKATV